LQKGTGLVGGAGGTGYPLADFFEKAGYSVYGIDISPDLVRKCRYLNPKVNCVVGDAEHLSWTDGCFGCVYCLHSTWYFPNLNQVIDEMLRVTLPSGLVVFDIQNRNNRQIADAYRKRLCTNSIPRVIRRVAKEWGRQLLRGQLTSALRLLKRFVISLMRGDVSIWYAVIYETPTFPEDVYAHLRGREVSSFRLFVKRVDEIIEKREILDSASDFGRLIFVVTK